MPNMKLASFLLALIAFAIASTDMQAKTHDVQFDRHDPRGFGAGHTASVKVAGFKQMRRKHQKRYREKPSIPKNYAARRTEVSYAAQIVAHPAGCPARAFCGCGASIEVFGRSIRDLWLARNWLRFPPAEPAPGMVAVRRHHVFVIREVRGPGMVLAYDANSGGRRTRIHLRSLAGYSVRNPHGGERYAAAR